MSFKKKILVFGLIVLFGCGFFAWQKINLLRIAGFNARGASLIKPFVLVQNSYFSEYGEYYSEQNLLRKQFVIDEADDALSFHLSHDEFPKEYLQFTDPPFLSKDGYTMVVVVRNRYDKKVYLWVAKQEQEVKLVETGLFF